MFDVRGRSRARAPLAPVRAPALPVEAMVLGKPVEEAADLLPRLFSLCRAAQALAVRRAFGLAARPAMTGALGTEILRDHLMKLHMSWPGQFGMAAVPLPAGWSSDAAAVRRAVFGPADVPPATGADFESFLASGAGAAPVLRRIDQCFGAGEAATGALPSLDRVNAFRPGAVENSVAGRHMLHPALRHLAETRGRGPLWRAAARLYDIAACLDDRLPAAVEPAPGRALVAAARGFYAVEAASEAGRVTRFRRVTPTDHLLAEGGILELSLAALPAEKSGLATLLLDILDPCTPVRLKEGGDA